MSKAQRDLATLMVRSLHARALSQFAGPMEVDAAELLAVLDWMAEIEAELEQLKRPKIGVN